MSTRPDITSTVAASYNKIAERYLQWVESLPSPRIQYVDKLLLRCPKPLLTTKVLELGCGAGIPVTEYLATQVGEVVANDVSEKQLELARPRIQTGNVRFVVGDMMALELEGESLDGAVAFFCLFHLPLRDQLQMLKLVYEWLKPGGVFVCNFSEVPDSIGDRDGHESTGASNLQPPHDGTWVNFFGARMFSSNGGAERSLQMMKDAGFGVVEWDILVAEGCRPHASKPNTGATLRFLWVVAEKSL